MNPLSRWMRYTLVFIGCYNLLVGLNLFIRPVSALADAGLDAPDLLLFVQLTAGLVALYGVGYLLVAYRPVENRSLLAMGFASKVIGGLLGAGYWLAGQVPTIYLVMVLFSEFAFLPPFAIILRRLYRPAN